MRKEQANFTISKENKEWLDTLSIMADTSKSAIIDSLLNMVKSYFTDDMLMIEISAHRSVDGRSR